MRLVPASRASQIGGTILALGGAALIAWSDAPLWAGQARLVGGNAVDAAAITESRDDEIARSLRLALAEREPALQASLMRGLRALNDQSLAPLFSRLSSADSAVLRAHALVGLAELARERSMPGAWRQASPAHTPATPKAATSPVPQGASSGTNAPPGPGEGGTLDVLLLRSMPASAQGATLELALEAGVLAPAQMADLCRWSDLPDGVFLYLAARIEADTIGPDVERLTRLARAGVPEGGRLDLALSAAAILAKRTGDDGALRALLPRVRGVRTAGQRDELDRARLLIEQGRISAAAPALRRALGEARDDRALRARVATTLLAIDPTPGDACDAVCALLDGADDADVAMLSLEVLEAAATRAGADAGAPGGGTGLGAASLGELGQRLASTARPGVQRVGRLLGAMARSDTPALARETIEAIASRDASVSLWAPRVAELLADGMGQRVRLALIDQHAADASTRSGALCTSAALALARGSSDDVRALAGVIVNRLRAGDALATRRLLDAACASGSGGGVGRVVVGLLAPGAGGGDSHGAAARPVLDATLPGDCLARLTLLRASGIGALDSADVSELTRVALGAGGLDAGQRAQAAWLVLRATGQDQAALAAVLAAVEP